MRHCSRGAYFRPNGRVGELVHVGNKGIVKRPWTDSESSDGSCYKIVDGCLIRTFNDTHATGRVRRNVRTEGSSVEEVDGVTLTNKRNQSLNR